MCGHRVRSNVEGEKLIVLLDNLGGASLKMDVATLSVCLSRVTRIEQCFFFCCASSRLDDFDPSQSIRPVWEVAPGWDPSSPYPGSRL